MSNYQQFALRAEQMNINGDHQSVIELLEPYANEEKNNNTSFFNELGIAYGKRGTQFQDVSLWRKAHDCHKKSYLSDSDEPIYMFNLAVADTWLENYEEAKELFRKYVESGHQKERDLAKDLLVKLEKC